MMMAVVVMAWAVARVDDDTRTTDPAGFAARNWPRLKYHSHLPPNLRLGPHLEEWKRVITIFRFVSCDV